MTAQAELCLLGKPIIALLTAMWNDPYYFFTCISRVKLAQPSIFCRS